MLVGAKLTDEQTAFLESTGHKFAIIGGTAAVNADVEAALKGIGSVERISRDSRYETSIAVAERSLIVLTYGRSFPDGLCGGPLAYAMGAP